MKNMKPQLDIVTLNSDDVFNSSVLTKGDFRNSNADSVSFYNVDLGNISFEKSNLQEISFVKCSIDGCNFSNSCIEDGYLDGIKCDKSKWTGVNAQAARIKQSVFDGCAINYANFRKVILKDVSFIDCDFFESDFQGAELSNVIFKNCDLRKAQMSQVVCKNVNLRGSQIQDISLEKENFEGLKVDTGQAIYVASLMGLDIEG